MVDVLVKEGRLVVVVNDLDFKIKDVAFEAKVFNRYGTFDWIANRSMEDPSYAYLHCDLLDKTTLTTITLKVKSLHIEMHEHHLQKNMFVKVEIFNIKLKSKRGFEKGDMHVVIPIKSITTMSSIPSFQLEMVPMFSHMDSIRKFRISIQSRRFVPIVTIVIGVKGIGDNKDEKKLLIVDRKGEFDWNVIALGNNFKIEYEQLKVYNGS